MSETVELSPLKRAYLALQDAQTRVAELESARTEAIAIVGMSARIPTAESGLDAFWALLREGRDAVGEDLPKRWREYGAPDADTEMPASTRFAALLQRQDLFDAELFGISPREANGIDPQQRALLEVGWEAFEHAGLAPDGLYGSSTGVFVGIAGMDYSLLRLATMDQSAIDGHFGSDIAHSIAAGRISYILGLRGPSIAFDTACSSSLVAIDRACRSLRDGECTLALAAGVNAILSTESSRTFARSGMLSPQGRCKSFAAGADGFVRGEGCAAIVLKRLSRAQADGDRVLAVILGSAINHDGPSSGLTVPSGAAQRAVVRSALENAGIAPAAVSYVEAHGTGTSLGDPIEAEALGAVFGATRSPDRPLLIGSVKSNIGHLEAAAGIAGLVKIVLALQHGELPASLHFDVPSPHIRWNGLGVAVVDSHRRWEPIDGRRIAGVSSFGFSGTNAHIVVAQAPAATAAFAGDARPVEILSLSARSEHALRSSAQAYAARLDAAPAQWADLCHTAGVGRARFAHRLSVRAATAEELRAGLAAFLDGSSDVRLNVSHGGGNAPRIGFLFTGQGSQYAGMGRALYAGSSLVRGIIDAAEAALAQQLDAPLGAVIRGEHADAAALLNQTLYTQPALYTLEYALAQFWRGLGVEPYALLGHSLGEYAAAAVSGVFSFEDGLRLVADRARMMHEVRADGAMLVVNAPEAQVVPLLRGYEDRVAVAGVNAPSQVTLSGARAAIDELGAACGTRGWRTVPLPVSQAFHSPLLDDMAVVFESRAAALSYAVPNCKLISNVTGEVIERIDAAYWRAHTRGAVRFADGIGALDALGCELLIEIGPRPTLLPLAQQIHGGAGTRRYVATLRGPGNDWDSVAQAVQQVQAAGVAIDWNGWDRGVARNIVDAPTYPFERHRHWIAPSALPRAARTSASADEHPLLGRRLRSAREGAQFEVELRLEGATAWLADHRIGDQVLLPATATIEMMLAAGAALETPLDALAELALVAPVPLAQGEPRIVQTVVDEPGEQGALVRVYALENAASPRRFRLHAQARLTRSAVLADGASDFATIRDRPSMDGGDAHYAQLLEAGAAFGPAFRGIVQIGMGEGEAFAEVRGPAGATLEPSTRPHPGFLDACLQTAVRALGPASANALPFALERLDMLAGGWPDRVFAHARARDAQAGRTTADLTVYDGAGSVLARVIGLSFRARSDRDADDGHDLSSWFYELEWRKTIVTAAPVATGSAAVVVGNGTLAEAIARGLRDAGRLVTVRDAHALEPVPPSNGAAVDTVVYVPPERAPGEGGESMSAGLERLLALLRLHAHHGSLARARLYVVTRDLHAVEPADRVALHDAAISGLASSASNEFPGLHCTRVDVSSAEPDAGREVAREIVAAAGDDWVAYRGGTRYAARMRRAGAQLAAPPFPVVLRSGGSIDSLRWDEASPRSPGDDEIEIDVCAAPLNFRDVVSVVGLIGDAIALGSECAGVVTRTGRNVHRFAPGDAVVAIASGAFSNSVVTSQALALHKPDGLSFEAAAAQTLVYLTADYALDTIAAMRAGQTALIHAGAGGVGLAAIALCRAAGVTVYATAGSASKRTLLRSLGVERVMDSRSLAFAAEVRDATGGRGVDIVLNSLAGEFVDASLAVTRRGGHFIEIGKTDIRERHQVAAAYPGVAYVAIDLSDRLRDDPAGTVARLREILARIEAGEVAAVPHRTYPFSAATSAFRDLAAARHVGKLVLGFPRRPHVPVVRDDGSYIVTGGLAGIGLEVGGWLAERGAGRVILVGRGAPSPEAVERIVRWREGGADVIVRRGDVSSYETVAEIVGEAGLDVQLRGIVHCANVLDDAPIGELTVERFATVMQPKAIAAWHLHRATSGSRLDFFVLFSSLAAIVGNRGGANYSAANVALDALAQHRHAAGLPALSLDWGAWSGTGWALRSGGVPSSTGLRAMTPQQGLRAFDTALHAAGLPQLIVAPIDWRAFGPAARELPSVCADLAIVISQPPAVARSASAPLADLLIAASAASRRSVAIAALQDLAGKALGIDDPQTIEPHRPLAEIGMDSILAVELRNMVAGSLRSNVSTTLLYDYPTVAGLADYALGIIVPSAPAVVAGARGAVDGPEALLHAIEDLSDDEVDDRLARRGADVA